MGLLRIAALGALGYAGYKFCESRRRDKKDCAFASDQATGDNFAKVRDAGPAATADESPTDWTTADQTSDESFPASDPPARY